VAALAVADELIVGAEVPLSLVAPEIAVTRNVVGAAETALQIHPIAAEAPAPFARLPNRLFGRLVNVHPIHASAPSS
jgi:hypothetical protein